MESIREVVLSGNLIHLQQLLDRGEKLDKKDDDERTPLHWAAGNGSEEVVEFLVTKAKAKLNVQDDVGWTPLMSAASAGHCDVVSVLLSNGADANVCNENGQLPLHYHKGRQQIVELLLDYTKNINHQDHLGNTPLMRAIGGKPSRGNTPLHLALLEGHEDVARFLVEHGADPMAKNNDKVRCIDLARNAFRAEMLTLQEKAQP